MSSNPTLVFVPGGWHKPSTWDKVTSLLTAQGHKCITVSLPSVSADPIPTATFHDDFLAVRNAITGETTQGRDVVVVVHSYGGVVGGSAVKGLTRPRQQQGQSDGSTSNPQGSRDAQSGHVVGLIYVASGFMPTGISFLDALGGTPPPTWRADTEQNRAIVTADPVDMFYHDLPADEAQFYVGELQNQSLKALSEGGEYVYAGWKDVPVWYVITKDDRGLPVAMQRMALEMAKSEGADVEARELDSGHSAMLSRPGETAEIINEAVKAFSTS